VGGAVGRLDTASGHCSGSQQALSDFIIKAGTTIPKGAEKRERLWPLLPSRFIGDEALDPTPPDERTGVSWSEERRNARLETNRAKAA